MYVPQKYSLQVALNTGEYEEGRANLYLYLNLLIWAFCPDIFNVVSNS